MAPHLLKRLQLPQPTQPKQPKQLTQLTQLTRRLQRPRCAAHLYFLLRPRAAMLPTLVTVLACVLLLLYGAIAQPAHYHQFADQSVMWGMPHAADVLSNLGFAVIALCGLLALWPHRADAALKAGWPGYQLFLVGLLLTALGSAFYHLAPDNFRLVWDRVPIALACAGLLAAVRAETHAPADGRRDALWLALLAAASVGWWYASQQWGTEDLRAYLLLQGLPLVLIPMWQTIYRSAGADRRMFALALLLYIAAKAAEMHDVAILEALGWISGHTLKHLLATLASATLVLRLIQRVRTAGNVAAGSGLAPGAVE